MKKSLLLASAALFAASLSTSAADVVTDTTLTYDFVKAGAPAVKLTKADGKNAFFAWESSSSADKSNQQYKGYVADSLAKVVGLPNENYIWTDRGYRLTDNIKSDGIVCSKDLNLVVEGLVKGDTVVVNYSAVGASSKSLYATGASGKAGAHLNGSKNALVAGVDIIESGAKVIVDSANYVANKAAHGYIAFRFFKNSVVSSINVIKSDTTLTYDFAKAGAPVKMSHQNRNQNDLGNIYVYESAASGHTDKNANNFIGYKADDIAVKAGLPSTCHVFQRQDRITGYLGSYGVKVVDDRIWAVDGLDADDQVQIYYKSNDADEAKQNIKYVTGASTGTVATLGDSKDAIEIGTIIKSGDVINITSATLKDKKGNLNGAIAFQAYKNMLIEKVVITKRTASTAAGIQDVAVKAVNADAAVYNLAGQKVGADYKGVVIKNGKKFVQK